MWQGKGFSIPPNNRNGLDEIIVLQTVVRLEIVLVPKPFILASACPMSTVR